MWMAAEKRRAAGELAAWHVLAVRAYLLADKPPTLDVLNPYAEPPDPETAAEVQRVKDYIAGRKLAALAGDPEPVLSPDARAALAVLGRVREAERVNDAATKAKVLEVLNRVQKRGS